MTSRIRAMSLAAALVLYRRLTQTFVIGTTIVAYAICAPSAANAISLAGTQLNLGDEIQETLSSGQGFALYFTVGSGSAYLDISAPPAGDTLTIASCSNGYCSPYGGGTSYPNGDGSFTAAEDSLNFGPGTFYVIATLTGTDPPIDFELSSNPILLPAATPLPGALALFTSGLGMVGLLATRRKRKAAALAAA
jgi:hypothetical protein